MTLLTNNELKELLKVSTNTLYNYRKGGMPFIQVNQRKFLYDKEKVLEWINNKK